eukprot:UN13550
MCTAFVNQHEECVAFEYGVNYGGVDGYLSGLAIVSLQDSSQIPQDVMAKDTTLDLYIKKSVASKVIDYHDCDIVNSVTSGTDDSKQLWNTQCPSNTAVCER